MLYVLEQRLKAQQVSAAKTARVLQDVAANAFDRAFLEEKLFVPQETWSLSSTKKIFARLAHSSIMRLSEARCAYGLIAIRRGGSKAVVDSTRSSLGSTTKQAPPPPTNPTTQHGQAV